MAGVDVTADPLIDLDSLCGGPPVVIQANPFIDRDVLGGTTAPYVYVVDAGNNRVNAYDYNGVFQFSFGSYGSGNGQFDNPYGVATDGTYVYVTDRGNHRVQVFTMFGVYVDEFGSYGTGELEFDTPMGVAVDSRYVWVVDHGNSRFQVIVKADYGYIYDLGEYGSGLNQFISPDDCEVDDVYFYIHDLAHGWQAYQKNFDFESYIEADLPAMTSEITAHVSPVCTIDADLPGIGSGITAIVSAVCTLDAGLPGMQSEINAAVEITAVIDAGLPAMTSEIAAEIAFTAVIDAGLPAMTSEIVSAGVVTGVIDAGLPAMTSEIITRILASDTFVTAVMNTLKKYVTEYTAFDFNSYTEFDDKQLAAHSDGNIYELTGEDDAGTDIAACFKSADIDLFGKSGPVRLGDILVHRVASDDILLTLQGDKSADKIKQYEIGGSGDSGPHTRRCKAPRGIKWRIVSVKIENKEGSDLDINQIVLNKAGESNRWT